MAIAGRKTAAKTDAPTNLEGELAEGQKSDKARDIEIEKKMDDHFGNQPEAVSAGPETASVTPPAAKAIRAPANAKTVVHHPEVEAPKIGKEPKPRCSGQAKNGPCGMPRIKGFDVCYNHLSPEQRAEKNFAASSPKGLKRLTFIEGEPKTITLRLGKAKNPNPVTLVFRDGELTLAAPSVTR